VTDSVLRSDIENQTTSLPARIMVGHKISQNWDVPQNAGLMEAPVH